MPKYIVYRPVLTWEKIPVEADSAEAAIAMVRDDREGKYTDVYDPADECENPDEGWSAELDSFDG